MNEISKAITAINTCVNHGARLDWNGRAFDLNECAGMPDDTASDVLETVNSLGITARRIVYRYFL